MPGPLGGTLGTFCFAILLFGSASAQIYNYWWNYPDEPQLHRHAVATVWLIDTVHTAVCIMALYRWMIVDFNDYQLIQNLSWPIAVSALFCTQTHRRYIADRYRSCSR